MSTVNFVHLYEAEQVESFESIMKDIFEVQVR